MGTFFTSEQEAQQSSGIISIIAVLPIAFASYFITNPDSSFTIAASYFPPLTPFMMIIRIGTESVGINEIFLTSLLMIISCWFMMKIVRKYSDSYFGGKINTKEILNWTEIEVGFGNQMTLLIAYFLVAIVVSFLFFT